MGKYSEGASWLAESFTRIPCLRVERSCVHIVTLLQIALMLPAGFTEIGSGHCVDSSGLRLSYCSTKSVTNRYACGARCKTSLDCAAYEWGQTDGTGSTYCQLIHPGSDVGDVCPNDSDYDHIQQDGSTVVKGDKTNNGAKCYLRSSTTCLVCQYNVADRRQTPLTTTLRSPTAARAALPQ